MPGPALAPEQARDELAEQRARPLLGLLLELRLALPCEAIQRVGVFHALIVAPALDERNDSYDCFL